MSDPHDPADSRPSVPDTGPGPQQFSAEDALPPIEPPAAGFILQLFFIPLLIVGIIVMIWLLFSWLAHMGSNPQQYVEELRKPGTANWQAASSLAEELRSGQNADLRRDEKMAAGLSDALSSQIEAGRMDADSIHLRMFLCRALGEFETPTVLPALLTAAKTERDPAELDVRCWALEAVALLSSNLGPEEILANDQTLPTLREAASDRGDTPEADALRSQLRERAAFALGVIGSEETLDLIATMQSDAVASVRYNSATGLARHGDPRAAGVLLEMLDPQRADPTEAELEKGDIWKPAEVIKNGLSGVELLGERNPTAEPVDDLLAAVKRLLTTDLPSNIRNAVRARAQEVLSRVQEKRAQTIAAPQGSS